MKNAVVLKASVDMTQSARWGLEGTAYNAPSMATWECSSQKARRFQS